MFHCHYSALTMVGRTEGDEPLQGRIEQLQGRFWAYVKNILHLCNYSVQLAIPLQEESGGIPNGPGREGK
jgi:hypothetical protein